MNPIQGMKEKKKSEEMNSIDWHEMLVKNCMECARGCARCPKERIYPVFQSFLESRDRTLFSILLVVCFYDVLHYVTVVVTACTV